jgi:hypothetical protein
MHSDAALHPPGQSAAALRKENKVLPGDYYTPCRQTHTSRDIARDPTLLHLTAVKTAAAALQNQLRCWCCCKPRVCPHLQLPTCLGQLSREASNASTKLEHLETLNTAESGQHLVIC